MNVLFFSLPFLVLVSALLMYRKTGNRELFRFDLVQFINSFVLMPVVFIWMKSFIFLLLKAQLNVQFSMGEIFIIDSVFSTIFMFVYAFVVIHSLTTTFKLQVEANPLYELFELSEYFHLWLSHIVVYLGSSILLTLLALINIFIPLAIPENNLLLSVGLVSGYIAGMLGYIGVLNGDPKQGGFLRIMKIGFISIFTFHVLAFFIFNPSYSVRHVLYWISFMSFFGVVSFSLVAQRSTRISIFLDKFKHKKNWGNNIDLFPKE